MSHLVSIIRQRREHWVIALMLLLLHLAMWSEFGSALSRSLMLAHLGLFLLWQPLWRGDQQLKWQDTFIFVILTLSFLMWINWWLVFGWLVLLIGLVGGRILLDRNERNMYMLVLIFLISELLIGCVTQLFSIRISQGVQQLFEVALLILLVCVMLIPPGRSDEKQTRPVDFLHGITMSLLISILALGSLVNMYSTGADYPTALLQTLAAIALFLFAISWLLSPHAGFSGLAQLWTRSLLSIGTPFEQWLTKLSRLAQQKKSPEEFLEASMEALMELPWVAGVKWNAPDSEGSRGIMTSHKVELNVSDISVTINSNRPVGVALLLHCKLLMQLLGNFHIAKTRERELTHRAHLHAIYETGARLTHDIKNLLQSLQTITAAMQQSMSSKKTDIYELVQRQLPHVSQRLQLALDKLQAPDRTINEENHLKSWWQTLMGRYKTGNIEFRSDIMANPIIPADLFDSIVDNLLENARNKRQIEIDLKITVTLRADQSHIALNVCDDGSRIQSERANALFKQPVSSNDGLGIGLYQAGKQAELLGYTLSLKHNEAGIVCFELSRNLAYENDNPQYGLFTSE
ncbi:MAG: HAMP domain-containing histidine kinase [Gammaproteobacteria bacterium]|nr:HAMP domain-containing histidine kinase [Gammaproteobacteria bacterium]MCI0590383.1 HAMP domain-containing histidine kinase [Gammaproteobacteria bacterium]